MRVTTTSRIELLTYGPNKLFDITGQVCKLVEGVTEGAVVLQAMGSTGALVLLPRSREVVEAFEYDLWDLVSTYGWRHPGNAYAHLRSTLIGTGLILPIARGEIPLRGNGIFFLENQPAMNRRRVINAAVIEKDSDL